MHSLCKAIRDQVLVTFDYDGSRRVVEPHMLSVYRDGDEMLHGWQHSGGSGSGWRDFETAKIENIELSDATFRKPHTGYYPNAKPYVRLVCRLEPVE
jgi:predicted DNA-binding transcriptional regulator YafY